MELKVFCAEMIRTGSALNRQPTEMMLETYFFEFKSWSEEQFFEAMSRCRQDLDFFPTVHQIRERFPSKKNLQRFEPAGLITQEPKANTGSLEANVNAMTDQEIIESLVRYGLNEETARMSCKRFRGNPESRLHRGLIKDSISSGWDDHNERRFRCLDCRDTGFVEVFTSRTSLLARKKTLDEAGVRTWMVVCRCQITVEKSERKQQNKCEPMMMKEPWMVPVHGLSATEQFSEIMRHYEGYESEGEDGYIF